MAPSTSAQRSAVASFVSVTGASERIAAKWLRTTGYKLHPAIDAYYQQSTGSDGSASASTSANRESQLKTLFDSLRDDKEDSKDELGADSAMAYLESIGTNLEDASLFVAMELLQAPSIGSITRSGFVKGWNEAGVDAKIESQKAHLKSLVDSLQGDRDLFKKVYRYTFVVGKEGDQRALSLEYALTYWEMLFKKPGQPWIAADTGKDWFAEYKAFLEKNWTRSVNRDMWNQTLEFAFKSMEDSTLGFWSEDGAWPGVIDEFVAWYRNMSKTAMDIETA
ncbi:Cullin binding-domain-containing protein [Xylariomycetidae sp. FL0641]|nr:Cullin binding-domain-containing protein [Xylariomycetidae sp. FL0641]